MEQQSLGRFRKALKEQIGNLRSHLDYRRTVLAASRTLKANSQIDKKFVLMARGVLEEKQ
jgi:hypothetical protein